MGIKDEDKSISQCLMLRQFFGFVLVHKEKVTTTTTWAHIKDTQKGIAKQKYFWCYLLEAFFAFSSRWCSMLIWVRREREKNVGWTHKKNHVSRSHSCWWYTQRMMIFFSVSRTIFFCTHIFLVDSKEDRKLFKNAKSIKIMRENGKIFLWSKVRSVDWSLLNFNLNEIKLL